jgi:hypothetical protein
MMCDWLAPRAVLAWPTSMQLVDLVSSRPRWLVGGPVTSCIYREEDILVFGAVRSSFRPSVGVESIGADLSMP